MVEDPTPLLAALRARGDDDPLALRALRFINRQAEIISSIEEELIQEQLSTWAYRVEFDRMKDRRAAWEAKRSSKAFKR